MGCKLGVEEGLPETIVRVVGLAVGTTLKQLYSELFIGILMQIMMKQNDSFSVKCFCLFALHNLIREIDPRSHIPLKTGKGKTFKKYPSSYTSRNLKCSLWPTILKYFIIYNNVKRCIIQ